MNIKATKTSTDMGDMPNAGDAHIQGSRILEFEVPFDGPAPTVIVDCLSKHAFDMYQVLGETLPRRACPLRPKGMASGKDGPPTEWVDQKSGKIKSSIWNADPKNPKKPSDLFAVISVSTCNGCLMASAGTVAIKSEQDAIRRAFDAQLKVEDFSGFDLTDEDRDHRRWSIHWEDISIG